MNRGSLPYVRPEGYERPDGGLPNGALILQTGCHADDLSGMEGLKRPPVVYERCAVPGELSVAPTFGAQVYFHDAPGGNAWRR
jgi:hypothetical protein